MFFFLLTYRARFFCVKLNLNFILFVIIQTDSDAQVLLNKNQIKAIRKIIFGVVREAFGISRLAKPLKGFKVDLNSAVAWTLREMRLHDPNNTEMELNIKIDGRPFAGEY
jgi:hypothetical protein